MDNVIEMDKLSDEIKQKLRDFDEQDAYFLLCQIFSNAQATKDYARFQSDLAEWKKRFPVELFSEEYKRKIKYMLSKEFMDTVLKGFMAYDELSRKDPSKGLEKLRKILDRAEKHKNAKELDKDLNNLYADYPLNFLKEKYPHLVGQLLSKSYRTKILQKFDSSLAFKELNSIVDKPNEFADVNEFKSAINEWQKLYPISDFDEKYKSQVEKTINETLNDKKLEEIFPASSDLNLNDGFVIPIEVQNSISLISKDALYDFFKIVDKNKNDIDSLFTWTCKYGKYINGFDTNTKNLIISNLMYRYSRELPPIGDKYKIPEMETKFNDLLTLGEYSSIEEIKKASILQLLGILYTGHELTNEDIYRLNTINANVQKANEITTMLHKAKIEPKLNLFMQKFPEHKLTPYNEIYSTSTFSDKISAKVETGIKFEPTKLSTTTSGATDNGGGFSAGIQMTENEIDNSDFSLDIDLDEEKSEETLSDEENIHAVVLEEENSSPEQNTDIKQSEISNLEQTEVEPEQKDIQPIVRKETDFEIERD